MKKVLLLCAMVLFAVANVNAVAVFFDDFEGSAWDTAAGGLPDSNMVQIKPVDGSSGLPNSWEAFKGDTNTQAEIVYLTNGVNQRGATLADTSDNTWLVTTQKRGVQLNLSALGLTSSDTIIVSFDWSSMDPIDWSSNIDYAVLDGPVDTAAGSPNISNAFSGYDLDNSFGSVTKPGAPSTGTVSFEVNLMDATSDAYLALFWDNWGNKGPVLDNVKVEIDASAINVSPADGATQAPGTPSELCFETPVDLGNISTINYDLYWSVDDDTVFDDPNYLPTVSGSADQGQTICVAIPEVTTANHTYYWKVALDIVGIDDPNDPLYDPNAFALAGYEPGTVWSFTTINEAPEVTINSNEFNSVWLSGGSADLDIDGTATDDGLPSPAALSTLWTSNPSAGVSFADDANSVTTATFTIAGDYELTLTATDTVAVTVGAPTIKVKVYAEGYDGLVARYEFEGDYTDSVNSHDGTGQGAVSIDADAKVGSGSLLCLAGDDFIYVADSGIATPDFDSTDPNDPNYVDPAGTWADFQTTNQATVSAWVKVDQWQQTWQHFVLKDQSWGLIRNGADPTSNAMFRVGTGSTADPRPERPARDNDAIAIHLTDGNWHHLAGTFDGYMVRLYVDGILEGINNNASDYLLDMPIGGGYLTIGNQRGSTEAGVMRIDQVRLHDVPLPADMIMAQFIADGGENSCRQQYMEADVNGDCSTDLSDIAVVAAGWLLCNDVTDLSCTVAIPLP